MSEDSLTSEQKKKVCNSPTLFHIAEKQTHSPVLNNHVSISQYNILTSNLLMEEFSFFPLGSSVKPTNKCLGCTDLALDYIWWNGQYSPQYRNPSKSNVTSHLKWPVSYKALNSRSLVYKKKSQRLLTKRTVLIFTKETSSKRGRPHFTVHQHVEFGTSDQTEKAVCRFKETTYN